jgi:nonsense-mediated mRNA decay protein 3
MHICPKCGAQEGSKKFIGPFCSDCYFFKIDIPNDIEVHKCKRCGKIKLHGKWIPYSEKKLKEYVEKKFKGEFKSVEFSLEKKEAIFQVEREGSNAEIRKWVGFELRNDICPECNKQSGGYFEAIVQLRGREERVAKYMRIFEEKTERHKTFISKMVELKEGLDLYIGSTHAVLAIVKELGLEHKISRTLAGQKQGKRLYRTTFAIRL